MLQQRERKQLQYIILSLKVLLITLQSAIQEDCYINQTEVNRSTSPQVCLQFQVVCPCTLIFPLIHSVQMLVCSHIPQRAIQLFFKIKLRGTLPKTHNKRTAPSWSYQSTPGEHTHSHTPTAPLCDTILGFIKTPLTQHSSLLFTFGSHEIN